MQKRRENAAKERNMGGKWGNERRKNKPTEKERKKGGKERK